MLVPATLMYTAPNVMHSTAMDDEEQAGSKPALAGNSEPSPSRVRASCPPSTPLAEPQPIPSAQAPPAHPSHASLAHAHFRRKQI